MLGALVIVAVLVCWLWRVRNDKLKAFDGPWLASWTDLWQIWEQWSTGSTAPFSGLDNKYDRVVRIGPNKLLFKNFSAAKDIFNTATDLKKSEFYPVVAPIANGFPVVNFFATTDVQYHDRIRRLISKSFQLTSVAKHENSMRSVWNNFIRIMDQKATMTNNGQKPVVDLALWSVYFTMDTASKISYGKPYGFLDAGYDFNGMIGENTTFLRYHLLVGQAPWLDHFLKKNPLLLWMKRKGYFNQVAPAVMFAANAQAELIQSSKQADGKPLRDRGASILKELIETGQEHPEDLDEREILKVGLSVVFAGGDSVGKQIAATLYYLLLHPPILTKLRHEIDNVPNHNFNFAHLRLLPYLDACIHEAMRMFPPTRGNQERITPPSGIQIDGLPIPGDTVICVNPWHLNRDTSIFGQDVEVFRPERWLEADETRQKCMKHALANFGYGKYGCIGQHIAVMETFVFVAEFLRRYDVEFAYPGRPWKWHLTEFIGLSDINVHLSLRNMS